MLAPRPLRCFSAALLATVAAPAAAQTTWIVDAAGGPGASFTSLPEAVGAASTGDTIIIRAGSYEGFTTSKGLRLLGEGQVQIGQSSETRGIEVTGLPAGTTFAAKNVQVDMPGISFFPLVAGLLLHDNDGRIHLEGVRGRLTGQSFAGVACSIARCREVTVVGGAFAGRPGIHAQSSTVALTGVDLRGDPACGASICATIPSSPAATFLDAEVHLSRGHVEGGTGVEILLLSRLQPASPAIVHRRGQLTVTGDATTSVAAGDLVTFLLPPQPCPAIASDEGTLRLDDEIAVTGTAGGGEVGGTSSVIRGRFVSLLAAGAPLGGAIQTEIVCPAGHAVGLFASLPADPTPFPGGTLFLFGPTLLTLVLSTQGPTEHFGLAIPVPRAPVFTGLPLALQAANASPTTPLTLSNAAVVIVW